MSPSPWDTVDDLRPVTAEQLDAHFVAAFGVLVEHAGDAGTRATVDGIEVTAVGAGGSEFNLGTVTRAPTDPVEAVRRASELLEAAGQGFRIDVPAPLQDTVEAALTSRGLELHEVAPGMVLLRPDAIPDPPAGLRIVEVHDEAELEANTIAAATGFGAPDPRAGIDVFPPTLLDEDAVILFNGYVDGADVPTATSVCVLAEEIAGIYAVTVHEPARRRGFGAAMTWAAIRAGRERGADVFALQASEMGRPVYERMGFVAVRDYLRFT